MPIHDRLVDLGTLAEQHCEEDSQRESGRETSD
jgi:hypothetical protein